MPTIPTMPATSTLAVKGGAPVRAAPFPSWPIHDRREVDAVVAVVESGRWAVTT